MVCAKESVTFDTFSNLSLELPPTNNRCSLSVSISSLHLYKYHNDYMNLHLFNCLGLFEPIFKWRKNKWMEMSRM